MARMPAYVISEVEVLDEQLADRYRTLAEASIRLYGGRYIIRGAMPEAAEGTWTSSRRLVVVEFPDRERARQWYTSPEYEEALQLRETALERRLLFVDGLPEELL